MIIHQKLADSFAVYCLQDHKLCEVWCSACLGNIMKFYLLPHSPPSTSLLSPHSWFMYSGFYPFTHQNYAPLTGLLINLVDLKANMFPVSAAKSFIQWKIIQWKVKWKLIFHIKGIALVLKRCRRFGRATYKRSCIFITDFPQAGSP